MPKYKYVLLFIPLFAACAHDPAVKPPAVAPAAQERALSRRELLSEAGKKPEAGKEKEDDFIDVDDKRGLLKTWPMALFVALVAAACGAL